MRSLEQWPPHTAFETLFTLFTVFCALVAMRYIPRLYEKGAAAAYLGGVAISFLPVQVIAFVAEGRRMWLPGQHSAIFFWGDLILLPGAAAGFALVRREWVAQRGERGAFANSRPWRLVCVGAAVMVGLAYHYTQLEWIPLALHAPSKVWHDYFVYPVFTYYLLVPLPYLVTLNWRRARVGAAFGAACVVIGVLGWWSLGHWYDPLPADARPALPLIAPATVGT